MCHQIVLDSVCSYDGMNAAKYCQLGLIVITYAHPMYAKISMNWYSTSFYFLFIYFLFIYFLYEFCTTPGVYTREKPPSHVAKAAQNKE